jgi:hypothetical protein
VVQNVADAKRWVLGGFLYRTVIDWVGAGVATDSPPAFPGYFQVGRHALGHVFASRPHWAALMSRVHIAAAVAELSFPQLVFVIRVCSRPACKTFAYAVRQHILARGTAAAGSFPLRMECSHVPVGPLGGASLLAGTQTGCEGLVLPYPFPGHKNPVKITPITFPHPKENNMRHPLGRQPRRKKPRPRSSGQVLKVSPSGESPSALS